MVLFSSHGVDQTNLTKPNNVPKHLSGLGQHEFDLELFLLPNAFLVLDLRRVLLVLGHACLLVLCQRIYFQFQAIHFSLEELTDCLASLQ